LRNQQFFSLDALNRAIRSLLGDLNIARSRNLRAAAEAPSSHRSSRLKALPTTRYEFAEWKKVGVGIDYHVEFEGHFYSVPHTLVKQKLQLRASATCVECFFKGKRLPRMRARLSAVNILPWRGTCPSPIANIWSGLRAIVELGLAIGSATRDVVKWQLENRPIPSKVIAPVWVTHLAKHYGEARLEAACKRALAIGAPTRKSIKSILEAKLDQHPDLFPAPDNLYPPLRPITPMCVGRLLPFHFYWRHPSMLIQPTLEH